MAPTEGPAETGPQAPPKAATPAGEAQERFDELLGRLRGVVDKLESGNLTLEDSLRFFEEGVALCRRGATILDSAERKVEVLLGASAGPGGAARTAPFDLSSSAAAAATTTPPASTADDD